MAYGKELILDLYGCDISKFNRNSIEDWLRELCNLIDMDREDLHFWDYYDNPKEKIKVPPHLAGTSAVQFITTSDIVIHTLDMLGECYINIFSCKGFDVKAAAEFTMLWFSAKRYESTMIARGRESKCDNVPNCDCMICVSRGECSGGRAFCNRFEKSPEYEKEKRDA